MTFFAPDSKFAKVMTSIGEMMLLNACWIVACLPLVTIGAANTAMYTVMGCRLREEGSGTVVPFFKAWWSNLKMGTAFWIPQVFVSVSLSMFFFLPLPEVLKVLAAVLLFLVSSLFSVVYPQIARYRNRWFAYLKNAVILLVLRFKWVMLNLIIFLAPVAVFAIAPMEFARLGFIWILFGFSGLFYLSARVVPRILQPLEDLT